MEINNLSVEEIWQQISLKVADRIIEDGLTASYTFHINDGDE